MAGSAVPHLARPRAPKARFLTGVPAVLAVFSQSSPDVAKANIDDSVVTVKIETWDGTGGSPSVIYIEQNEEAEQAVHGNTH